jgi:hypothetical protein
MNKHIGTIAVLIAGLFYGAPTASQAPIAHRSVDIVLIEDYPAFNPAIAEERGIVPHPLRAFAFTEDPRGNDHAVILLNPDHLTAETLHEMLARLDRHQRLPPSGQTHNLLVLSALVPLRPVPENTRSRLERLLEELQAQPVRHMGQLGGFGRTLSIRSYGSLVGPTR